MNKKIGWLLIIIALLTIAGMMLDSKSYWLAYNILVILAGGASGFVLLRKK